MSRNDILSLSLSLSLSSRYYGLLHQGWVVTTSSVQAWLHLEEGNTSTLTWLSVPTIHCSTSRTVELYLHSPLEAVLVVLADADDEIKSLSSVSCFEPHLLNLTFYPMLSVVSVIMVLLRHS